MANEDHLDLSVIQELFWSKVQKTDNCWLWTGNNCDRKYGRFLYDKHQYVAHRVAYKLLVGSIPRYMVIYHTCDQRLCVNPKHLILKKDNEPLEGRFWSKVNRKGKNKCWEWTACRNRQGYGYIAMGGKLSKPRSAHRVSWELHYGSIPNDLEVLHKCDNPPCVNPNHLFLGTQLDNVQDMIEKGRMNHGVSKTYCPRGHPYSGENLMLSKDGHPLCKICRQIQSEEYRKRKKIERQILIDAGLETFGRSIKTHCPYGHPYSQENTYIQHGIKVCRTCRRLQDGKRRKQKNQYNRERYRKKMQSLKSIITQDL